MDETGKLDADFVRRLRRALTAGAEELFQVLLDPSPEVLRNLLKNPHLAEEHLLALLKRRDLSEEFLKAVHQREGAEASHRLKVALVRNPATPAQLALTLLPHLYLFELLELCILPGTTPDQRLAAERQIILRLPTIELGNKLTMARRAPSGILDALLREGEPTAVAVCLDNPRLKELAVLQMLRSGRATPETISMVARHPRWGQRVNLRQSILRHRKTPLIWFLQWLPRLKGSELKSLSAAKNLTPQQRKLVAAEWQKRQGRGT